MEGPSGFLIVDKPLGITSRAAVDRAARWFPRGARLGHTGTLDPLATGVLVLAVGQGTRLTDYVQRMDKVYRAGIRLGARSDTDDAEGTIIPCPAVSLPTLEIIQQALAIFVGEIEQVPPAYSAAKVFGRRAYALARRGAQVELAPRRVTVYDIRLLHYEFPDLEVEVRCGKGTYIRSLARDLGDRLGCGGYIQALRRTRVGPYDATAAFALDADDDLVRRSLLDLPSALVELPRVELAVAEAQRFAQGQAGAWAGGGGDSDVAVWDATGRFIGVGRVEQWRTLSPIKIFHADS